MLHDGGSTPYVPKIRKINYPTHLPKKERKKEENQLAVLLRKNIPTKFNSYSKKYILVYSSGEL